MIKIMYTNCQSVMNKRAELRGVVATLEPDLICMTECWTNESVEEGILGIENFELLVRKDRTDTANGRGGGILVYGRSGLVMWEADVDADFCQGGGVRMKNGGGYLSVYVCYRSPNSPVANDNKLCEWIDTLRGDFVLVGDFNYPRINWQNRSSDGRGSDFLEVVERNFISQHVEGGTHKGGNKLDLILASAENLVIDVRKEGRLGSSDHEILMATVEVDIRVDVGGAKKRDWKKADFACMRRDLEIDWEVQLEGKDVNDTWTEIRDKIKNAMNKSIP